jgi:hypothetical protein
MAAADRSRDAALRLIEQFVAMNVTLVDESGTRVSSGSILVLGQTHSSYRKMTYRLAITCL